MKSVSLASIKNFLLDMDGTLYLGSRLFPETEPFLQTLRDTGRKKLFLTNNSSRSVAAYLEKLKRMGIPAMPEEILTSGTATMSYLHKQVDAGRGKKIYLLATPSLELEFLQAGFELVEDEKPDWVVLGFDRTLTYEKIAFASRCLLQGVPFVATHPDLVCPTEDLPIPDTGAMIKMFEAATNVSPKIIGKPNREMVEAALDRLGAKPEETAIVGDRYYTDMEMGFRAGLVTILVLSGEAKGEELKGFERQPDFVLKNVGELAGILKS